MKQKWFLSLLLIFFVYALNAQVRVNKTSLKQIIEDQKIRSDITNLQVEEYLNKYDFPKTIVLGDKVIDLQYIDKSGKPQYLVTSNAVSAETISTNEIHQFPNQRELRSSLNNLLGFQIPLALKLLRWHNR